MTQLQIIIETDISTSKRKRVESDESDGDGHSYQVTPHYESISSDDESHTSPIYPSKKQVPFPWEVSLAFVPGYSGFDPKLLEVVYVHKKISDNECSSS